MVSTLPHRWHNWIIDELSYNCNTRDRQRCRHDYQTHNSHLARKLF